MIDIPDLPMGSELKRRKYQLFPSHQSGTVIPVRVNNSVFLSAQLSDQDQKPIAQTLVQLINVESLKKEPLLTFTNSKGTFSLAGIEAGTYHIRLPKQRWKDVKIVIPNEQLGLYDLGIVTCFEESSP